MLPLPKNSTPLSAFGLDFRPFEPHSAASSSSLHPPQCIGVLIKTRTVPIFGAKECIRMRDFVFKIYKKFGGTANPGPPQRKGRHCSHPPPYPPLPDAGAPPLLLGWLRPCLSHRDQILNLGHMTLTTPTLGVICHPMANTTCCVEYAIKYEVSSLNRSKDINGS